MSSERTNSAGLMNSSGPSSPLRRPSRTSLSRFPTNSIFSFLFLSIFLLSLPSQTNAIKFVLTAHRHTTGKCIWNPVHDNQLVIVTANVGPGEKQRVDVEIVDSSPKRNVYLSKKNIKGETRLAITSHAEGEVGVCLKNILEEGVSPGSGSFSRTIDLEIDIGADAIDYNAIANQESLSALETEMRKLEGIVNEIQEEFNYLKQRESRFTSTNESTNARVTHFGFFTFVALVALGVWQILHLRSYFKRKYLID